MTVNVGQVQILSFTGQPGDLAGVGFAGDTVVDHANATSVVLVGADISPTNLPVNGSLHRQPNH